MSIASELALALEEGRYEDADTDDVIQELRRLDRVNADLVEALREGRNDLVIAAAHWNQDEDRTVADFHRDRVLALVKRVDAALTSATKETT